MILLLVVRPLYVRCQPDRQTPLHRHVLHRHGGFMGNGNSVKSGTRRNGDNVPFPGALYKLISIQTRRCPAMRAHVDGHHPLLIRAARTPTSTAGSQGQTPIPDPCVCSGTLAPRTCSSAAESSRSPTSKPQLGAPVCQVPAQAKERTRSAVVPSVLFPK